MGVLQDLDDSVWNVSMAAGVCLGLVALAVRDEIIPLVIAPFVQVLPTFCHLLYPRVPIRRHS